MKKGPLCRLIRLFGLCLTLGNSLFATEYVIGQVYPKSENPDSENNKTDSTAAAKLQKEISAGIVDENAVSTKESNAWAEIVTHQQESRQKLRELLGIPTDHFPLEIESRGQVEHDGIIIEKWVFCSEPGSRIPAVLYRPKSPHGLMPAIVLTYGHGCSKSHWAYNYAGLLYAKLGIATLACDPIGEEERHIKGELGTRAHDPETIHRRADQAGRLIMGKFVFDAMRCIDFLKQRSDIDPDRIGIVGHSLGGATAGWVVTIDPRIKMALVCGWAYDDTAGKFCTNVPNQRMRQFYTWSQYAALGATHSAILIMNGDADEIIDRDQNGKVWQGTKKSVADVERMCPQLRNLGGVKDWLEPEGGHRPYFLYKEALEWIHHHLSTPNWTLEQIRQLPVVNAGRWCDAHDIKLEPLYGTWRHERGATLADFKLTPNRREDLRCLRPSELGMPEFTLEGWLDNISAIDK